MNREQASEIYVVSVDLRYIIALFGCNTCEHCVSIKVTMLSTELIITKVYTCFAQ
jgi:hypothetical protein